MSGRIDVGVLAATGTVGQRLVQLLDGHPWFRLAEVGASSESVGRRFGEVLDADPQPVGAGFANAVLDLTLKDSLDEWASPVLLSALPSQVAGSLEAELAGRGHLVVSNAASHRMEADVPLVIPEVNPDHLRLLELQRERWPGGLVTNPNCSVVGLAVALAPLHRTFGVRAVTVTTLQALSGAGRPGPAGAEILDNVLPYIPDEEEKLGQEPQKILGELGERAVRFADFPVSAQTHRVPVAHGHLLAVSAKLGRAATSEEVTVALASFRSAVLEECLPSAPQRVLELLEDQTRPQPRLDRDRGGGMTVSVGRVRRCEVADVKFLVLVHNLVRGAAGAALLNAELCHVRGATRRAGAR